jgi:hypothetical protein
MNRFPRAKFLISFWTALVLATAAQAQVASRIVVGVTPTCPYGILACSGAAHEALGKLDGVESVTSVPDGYNCTFDVEMERAELPRIHRWNEQFKAVVGEVFVFRGIEITVNGRLAWDGEQLMLHVPGLVAPIGLAPLKHKLQWNFRKQAPRQPEPAEQVAFQQLTTHAPKEDQPFVQITGPLLLEGTVPAVEVREYFLLKR